MLVLALSAVLAAAFPPAETAAIYAAAGFVRNGSKLTGCDAADAGWPRSDFSIEGTDLSGDGKPEAIVTESNIACYGRDEMAFTIVAKGPDGRWHRIGGNTGGTLILKTRHNGWLDIEYGGPGFDKRPVLRFDGKAYR